MTQLINFSADDYVNEFAYFRVTFGPASSWNPDFLFSSYFGAIADKFQQVTHLAPVNPISAPAGSTSSVVDARNLIARNGAEIVTALESLNDNFVEVQTVEMLDANDRANINTTAGAAARDDARKKAASDNNNASALTKFLNGLGVTLETAKWIAIAVVAVVLLAEFGKRGE